MSMRYSFGGDEHLFVECSEETWRRFGFDRMDQAETIAVCEKLFAKYLGGHSLQSNAAHLVGSAAWLNFRRIKCERWNAGNVILLGDAAHTAHFSIGSGTKLALEDAIKLAEVLNRPGSETSWVRRAPLWPIGFFVTWQRISCLGLSMSSMRVSGLAGASLVLNVVRTTAEPLLTLTWMLVPT